MKKRLSTLAIFGSMVLFTGCMLGKRADVAGASGEEPGSAHRTGWVRALATGDSCVPDKPSNFKGVCLAAAAWPEARLTAPLSAPTRFWGMTFRERYQGAQRRGQEFHPAALELSPAAEGGVSMALFELLPESEADLDYLGSACERFDDHFFRGAESLPEENLMLRLRHELDEGRRLRQEQLQPTPQGYRVGARGMELRPFKQGWMLVTEKTDPSDDEETRVLGVFVPLSP
ncbi:hypothetical protein [Hyalangium gracile]|uniref:hypothetical protein n=1 Tax=Hyalangium gracile TaxID=394092 RepID=UPI001CCF1CB3|nr:hypothetical protein [Hyalangium gracile]